jgi:tRNA-guanine family transglycosylase
LITLHNLHFYLNLMRHARAAIENGTFNEFRFNFVANYKGREVDLTLS